MARFECSTTVNIAGWKALDMDIHGGIDYAEGWIRSRHEQAPVSSAPDDLERLLDIEPSSVHPNVEPASLSFGPSSTERPLWSRLPPSSPPRVTQPFTFRSPVESPITANNEVPGVRWHGPGREDAETAIVLLHGAFAPSFAAEKILSVPLLRRDVHVLPMAAPYHMERAPSNSEYWGQYLLSGDVPRFIDGMVQAVADTRSLIAGLREQGYANICVSGISLGGNIAAQTLATTTVDAGVLAIPAIDFAPIISDAPIARGIRRSAATAGFDYAEIEEALQIINPLSFGDPISEPRTINVIYGKYDRQAPASPTEELIEEWAGVAHTCYPVGHRTMGFRILALRHQMAGWFDPVLT